MHVLSSLYPQAAAFTQGRPTTPLSDRSDAAQQRDLYDLLWLYYVNTNLYDDLAARLHEAGIANAAVKGLRNPANRIVEFYVSKVWPGPLDAALKITTGRTVVAGEDDPLDVAIKQIWKWSNWEQRKQVAVRTAAVFGDLFLKVVGRTAVAAVAGVSPARESRVYFQRLDPRTVNGIDHDERGFLTFIRIDVPQQVVRTSGLLSGYEQQFHTEVWDKAARSQRIWVHKQGLDTELDKLGVPDEEHGFDELGVDFIPIVHERFYDLGEARGFGSYQLHLDKITECDRLATRLHQMMFRHNRPYLALEANAMDREGRPVPPPRITGSGLTGASPNGRASGSEDDTVSLREDDLQRLPGMSKLTSMVPQIAWQAHLDALKAMIEELEADKPELAWYRLVGMGGDASGKAIRYRLAPAIDRVIEVRGNLYAALIRANQMGITIGQAMGIDGWSSLGSFDNGDLEHGFVGGDVVPLDPHDVAIAEKAEADAKEAKHALGVPKRQLLLEMGYTNEQIDGFEEQAATEAEEALERQMAAMERAAGVGGNPAFEGSGEGEKPPMFSPV